MPSTTVTPDVSKFEALRDVLGVELVERKDTIDSALLALVGSSTFFMLGEPGVAKSLLPTRMGAYIGGAKYFDLNLNKFTQDGEIFGPTSMLGLQEDRFERVLDGYLPDANFCMLDEVFKGSSSIINTLLRIINERTYRHGKTMIRVPLTTVFAASNELPLDDTLGAFYDRLVIRRVVERIIQPENFKTMLRTQLPENPEPILTWAEVAAAQEAAKLVVIPEEVLDAMVQIRKALKDDHQIEPSDRRFMQSLKIVRAAAWLDECEIADIEHLRPLQDILWSDPAQRPDVQKLVVGLANPLDVEAMKLLDEINKLEAAINGIVTEDDRVKVGNEINGKVRKAKSELDNIRARAGASAKRNRKVEEVQDRLRSIADRILIDVFKFSPEEAENIRKADEEKAKA